MGTVYKVRMLRRVRREYLKLRLAKVEKQELTAVSAPVSEETNHKEARRYRRMLGEGIMATGWGKRRL